MSRRNFCNGTIGITLLSEHAVLNDVFAKTHNLQRIYANTLKALLYVRMLKSVACLILLLFEKDNGKHFMTGVTMYDRNHTNQFYIQAKLSSHTLCPFPECL